MVADLRASLQETLGAEYTVERELGGGGMSRVFLAHERDLNRRVVVKVLPSELSGSLSVERFKREILMAAALQHPHIVAVHSAGETDGLPYFVMPYVEGASLRDRLRDGPLELAEAVGLLEDVAKALVYAHAQGVVHRDIKPDNVLLTAGAAVLTDFGVAKAVRSSAGADPESGEDDASLTMVGMSLGTPSYMAPEQVAGERGVDHRADIYAFGAMAYEVISGRPPFQGRSSSAIFAAHIAETPASVKTHRKVPEPLAALIMRCLAKDPADRPQSAEEIVAVLGAVLAGGHGRGLGVRSAVVAGAVVVAAAVGIGIGAWSSGRTDGDFVAPAASIAVLPFANVGGSPDDEYFADGMTDELITALHRVPNLRVASRTAVFPFKQSTLGVQQIGEALQVATLLEGSIRRGGARLRLTARLVNVDDGLTMWSETFEREMADVFAVQDEVATSITDALRDRLGPAPGLAAAGEPGTADLEAYDLYLRGRYHQARRGEEALRSALDYFRRAAARDSGFAEAYAGIADVLGLLPLYSPTPRDAVFPEALRAADRAVSLDGNLAAAYTARANLLNSAWRWDDAGRDYRRAIELNPNDATARQWYGEHLLIIGDVEEAVPELAAAAGLDPVSSVIAASYAVALGTAKRHDEAMAAARRAVEIDSTLVVARALGGAVYLYAGRDGDAVRELEAAARLAPGLPVVDGLLGYAYGLAGRSADARMVLASVDTTTPGTGGAAAIARIHLGLGDVDRAAQWLERAVAERDPMFGSESLRSPIFDRLRDHPSFATVLRRLGLDPERFGVA